MINNRELSWLSFNQRVLQEAQDVTVPLMQRLRFLGIFSNNLDEFLKVRMANLIKLAQFNSKKTKKTLDDDFTAKELLSKANSQIKSLQKEVARTYTTILAEMEQEGIFVINETQLNSEQIEFCQNYFSSVVSIRLVPLILRKSTKIPFLSDNRIYHVVKMEAKKQTANKYAIIQIPVSSACPRFIELPSTPGRKDIIFLDDIIRLFLDDIFFMFTYEKITAYTFKIIRDAELTIDDDISKSLIQKMEMGIENRLHGQPIRLIYDREMPAELLQLLSAKLKINAEGLSAGGRYHQMRDLMKFPKVRPDLESKNPLPLQHSSIEPYTSILSVIKKKDIFLNYPYHTFNHFLDFLREAAIDPRVESIYITLYRTAENSKVINTLVSAAKNGKKVIVLIELLARFDEDQNVRNSEYLHKEGIKVIHGVNGLKVHSKLVLVERKEGTMLRGYAYVGTGNFNENTAQIYTDFGLFTCHPQIVSDTRAVFEFLQNTHKHFLYQKLLVSPYSMREEFKKLIYQEIKNAEKGKKAYIYAKFNSLTDKGMINLLYKASQAGVEVKLIIRGAFCLVPEKKGLSENIRAISIVDQYLEHSRMVIFCNDDNEKVFISSADWMKRNLDHRIEIAAPVLDKQIKETLIKLFQLQWSDNVKARNLATLEQNNYVKSDSGKIVRSQTDIYDFYKEISVNNKLK